MRTSRWKSCPACLTNWRGAARAGHDSGLSRFSRNTNHETRNTAFMLPYPPFPTISRHFPALFGPPTPQPIKGPPAVHRSGWAAGRAPFVGNPTKMHKIPDPTGKCAKHSVSLYCSPRGEAKWVRGPSGRGASRAKEKGASRLARAGVLDKSLPSPLGSRNTAFPVHWPSDISSGANQAPSHGFHESRDTRHESRPFIVCFDRRVVRNAGLAPPSRGQQVFPRHESRNTAFKVRGASQREFQGFHEKLKTKN